jgi:hypothetical protein
MCGLPYDSATAECLDHFSASSMNPSLHGPQWAIECRADFGIAQLLLVKQQKRLPVFAPQTRQRSPQLLSQVPGRLVVGPMVREVLDQRRARRAAHPLRQMAAAAIAGDRQQPGQELAASVPPRKAFQRARKGFLSHVLRVLALAKHAIAQAEYLALEKISAEDLVLKIRGRRSSFSVREIPRER